MSFLDFFKKKKNYHPLYPDKVKGLTDQQKSYFDFIATQYKRLSYKSNALPTLLQAFFNRYDRACRQNMEIDVFLQAEEEALEIYKEKKKQAHQKIDQEVVDGWEEEENYNKNEDISRKIKYPRVLIHEKANQDIERLYGALIKYEKKFKNGLLQATKVINEAEFQQIIYGVVYGLEDFTHAKGKFLPFVFSHYSFELDKGSRVKEHLEREIFTKITIVFDKIQKIILWSKKIDQLVIAKNPFSFFVVDNIRMNFTEFFYTLEVETNSLINDFNLETST